MSKILLDPKNSANVEINPMVVGIKSSQCKLDKICVHIASGFGKEIERCKYLIDDGRDLFCTALVQDNKHE